MGQRKKDDTNDDADSVVSSTGSVNAVRYASKRSRQSLNKSASGSLENLRASPSDLGKEFVDILRNYRNNNGRLLCEFFIRLPTKRTNMDYYNSVKQPIDLIKIQQKLKTDEYETFEQFDEDIVLLFSNAINYYEEGTIEYNDAKILKEVYEGEKNKKLDLSNTEMDESKEIAKPGKRTTKKEVTQIKMEEEDVEDENESEDDADSKIGVPTKKKVGRPPANKNSPAKSKPGRRKTLDTLNTSLNSENSETSRSKSKAASQLTKHANLDIYLEDYFDAICSHQDKTQRYLANVFYLLPEAKDYPDYYEVIKNPMDMKKIAKKMLNSEYASMKQMESDLTLILDNAKRYNEPKSIIYKDACKLKTLSRNLSKQISTLMSQNKFLGGEKSREKKQKLIGDISQTNHAEFQDLLIKNFEQSHEKPSEQEQGENEDEDEDDEDSEDDDETENIKKENVETEKRPKQARSAINAESKSLMKSMWTVFDHIKEYTLAKRQLIDPFVKMPSKTLYPDYYEDIKKPMALNCIKKKLNKRLYQTAREFFEDFELIFKNAMQYNVEESLIYKDAQLLLDELEQKKKESNTIIDTVLATNTPKTLTPSKTKVKKIFELTKHTVIKAPNLNMPIPKFADLKEKLTFLYNYINDFQHEGRDLAPPFRLLPSKIDYPDYYNVIKKAIDMNKIWNKINHPKTESYSSVDDMCIDFAQMFENACTYNEPASTLYKDALNLQRALFNKRDEMSLIHNVTTSTGCFSKDPVNDFQAEVDFIRNNCYITNDFVSNAFQCLIEYLFEQTILFQDMEGRTLSESFLHLYNLYEMQNNNASILTFNMIKKRLYARVYKRMDVFQDEMFQVFNQIRVNSFYDTSLPIEGATFDIKIHRYSQLFRDAYDLQRYFIQKRDEVCNNGELLQTNALSFKYSSLDQYLAVLTNAPAAQNYDEAEVLLVNKRYRPLESQLETEKCEGVVVMEDYQIGNFYYIERELVKEHIKDQYTCTISTENKSPLLACILGINSTKTNFIFQIYLQPQDTEFFDSRDLKTRRFYAQETFKTDLYIKLSFKATPDLKKCLVVGLKEHIAAEHIIAAKETPQFTKSDIFMCESIYSTHFKFFRKIMAKKWSPLTFITPDAAPCQLPECITVVKRSMPLIVTRSFLDEQYVTELVSRVDTKLNETSKFVEMHCSTVAYDSAPVAALKEKGDDDYEIQSHEEDLELNKKATYYEQVLFTDGELYKLGDYVYAKSDKEGESDKPLMIIRIDRIWSLNTDNFTDSKTYYLRGALFLRPTDFQHEPTHLFYKNEVYKEISREVTICLSQVTANSETNRKKCSVMNSKQYVSSRITEIDERDVYVCEAKYSLQLKTFRKFTKGLKKFELSIKCNEDEIYYLRHEIQLHKKLSPLLVNLFIDYDEEMPVYEPETTNMEQPESNDEEWSDNGEPQLNDENSSQSFISNRLNDTSFDLQSPISAQMLKLKQQQLNKLGGGVSKSGKKLRVKRLKKCGYNIFSKEFRKSLRDTKSSLSFIDMSKEVGNRWRALSETQRADYEEKARRETIIEAQKMVADEREQAAKLAAEQAKQAAIQAQNPTIISQNSSGTFMNQQNVMVLSPQTNGQASIQMVNNQMYLNPNTNIINTAQSQQVVYLNQTQNGNRPIQQIPYQQGNQYVINNPAESQQNRQENIGPKQVQHKEAYVKYIANMRKQQQLHSQPQSHVANSVSIMPDWYNNLDIRSARVKESRVAQPPSAWIENVPSSDVMQHLLSLRYNMLADAVNIDNATECYRVETLISETAENESAKEFTEMETCKDL